MDSQFERNYVIHPHRPFIVVSGQKDVILSIYPDLGLSLRPLYRWAVILLDQLDI